MPLDTYTGVLYNLIAINLSKYLSLLLSYITNLGISTIYTMLLIEASLIGVIKEAERLLS